MGISTDPHCDACGYDTFLGIGVGMNPDYRPWPVNCETCVAITTANVARSPLACADCGGTAVIPIADKRVWQGDGGVSQDWLGQTLTDGHYRCPKCGMFKLRFGGFGRMMWD